VAVSPQTTPLNTPTTTTVTAANPETNGNVDGRVVIDGQDVAATGTPFEYTFATRTEMKKRRNPETGRLEFEEIEIPPSAVVRAVGFGDSSIPFVFV